MRHVWVQVPTGVEPRLATEADVMESPPPP
jgi:hypothetical protein